MGQTPLKYPQNLGVLYITHTRARSIDWCQFPHFRPFLDPLLKGVYL